MARRLPHAGECREHGHVKMRFKSIFPANEKRDWLWVGRLSPAHLRSLSRMIPCARRAPTRSLLQIPLPRAQIACLATSLGPALRNAHVVASLRAHMETAAYGARRGRAFGWLNVAAPGASQDWHAHSSSAAGVVIFLRAPPTRRFPDACIEFEARRARGGRLLIRPRPGDVLVFPAHLPHRTHPFARGARISLAFDLEPLRRGLFA